MLTVKPIYTFYNGDADGAKLEMSMEQASALFYAASRLGANCMPELNREEIEFFKTMAMKLAEVVIK